MSLVLPWLSLLLCSILAGASYPVIRYLVTIISPADLVALTFIPATIISFILIPAFFGKTFMEVVKKDWWLFLFLGALSIFGFQYVVNYVVTVLPSGAASLIVNTWPILTIIMGSIFLGERMTTGKVSGTLIAFAGTVVLIIFGAQREAGTHDISAAEWMRYSLITLLCPVTAATVTTISRWYLTRNNSNNEKASPALYALLMRLPTGFMVLTFWKPSEFAIDSSVNPDMRIFIVLVLIVIISRVFGFLLWNWALQRIEAGNTAIFSYIQAIFAISIARFVFGETIGPATSWGAAFIIVGVVVANLDKWKKPVKPSDLPMKPD